MGVVSSSRFRSAEIRSSAIDTLPYDGALFAVHAQTIADNARELAALGWTPATSSNFSMRLDDRHAAVTVSGRDKGKLGANDIMVVDFDNRPVATAARPSAETALHTQIYRRFPAVGAVLHTHSRAQSVASRLFADAGNVRFEGWELQKAISGYDTHESVLDLPVFPNTQDMARTGRAHRCLARCRKAAARLPDQRSWHLCVGN